MKKYLSELPVPLPDLEYKDDSKDAIILLPFYQAFQEWFPMYLIRASRWARQSFINNTTITEHCIPIKWFVERAWWDTHRHISDMPDESQCIFFDAAPGWEQVTQNRISKAIYAFDNPEISGYDQVIIWDCDLFVCRDKKYDRLDIHTLLSENPTTLDLLWWDSKYNLFTYKQKYWWWDKFGKLSDVTCNYEKMEKQMNSLLPSDKQLNEYSLYPALCGGIKRFSPKRLSQEFIEFALKAEPIIADEENIFHLWHHKTGEQFGIITKPPFAWTAQELLTFRDKGIYLSHVYEGSEDPKGWDSYLHADIGYKRT